MARCEDFPTKDWNAMQEQAQVNKKEDLCLNNTDKLIKEWGMYVKSNLKALNLNSTDKLIKEWGMYIKSNLKALKFQEKRYHFRLWVFTFISFRTFAAGTEEYYPRCNNAKGLQILYHYCNITLHLIEVVN